MNIKEEQVEEPFGNPEQLRNPLMEELRAQATPEIQAKTDALFKLLDQRFEGMAKFKQAISTQMGYGHPFDTAFELAFRTNEYMIYTIFKEAVVSKTEIAEPERSAEETFMRVQKRLNPGANYYTLPTEWHLVAMQEYANLLVKEALKKA